MKSRPAQARAADADKVCQITPMSGRGQEHESEKMEDNQQPANEPNAGNRIAPGSGHGGKGHGQQRNCDNIRKFAPIHQAHLICAGHAVRSYVA